MAAPNRKPTIKYTQLFINNEWRNSVSGKTFSTINPATGEKIIDVQEGDKADIDLAVDAARTAFKFGSTWRTMDASARAAILFKFADLIGRDIDELSSLDTIDSGRTYQDSYGTLVMAQMLLKYYGGWADKIHGKTIPANGNVIAMTRIEPVGVCGMIIPWNAPAMFFVSKLAPALACGCVAIVKPAENTPLTALALMALLKEAGLPGGVVNVIPGFGHTAGAALAEHPKVDKISFTGSTAVGKLIQQAAGKNNLKRVTLELGGKSPLVIFDDADLDLAVTIATQAVFYNQGQACISASRTFVQETIYDEFVKRAAEVAKKRLAVVGDPFESTTVQGPQISEVQLNRVLALIEKGKKEGGKLEAGGGRHGSKGFFVQPTVFSEVTDSMAIAKEEIFGPVMQILKFKTFEEVVERANDTDYGLAAAVITKDIDKALMFAQAVQSGNMWINTYAPVSPNTPFGGFKNSGVGREFGEDGLHAFCEIKTIAIAVPQKNS